MKNFYEGIDFAVTFTAMDICDNGTDNLITGKTNGDIGKLRGGFLCYWMDLNIIILQRSKRFFCKKEIFFARRMIFSSAPPSCLMELSRNMELKHLDTPLMELEIIWNVR